MRSPAGSFQSTEAVAVGAGVAGSPAPTGAEHAVPAARTAPAIPASANIRAVRRARVVIIPRSLRFVPHPVSLLKTRKGAEDYGVCPFSGHTGSFPTRESDVS